MGENQGGSLVRKNAGGRSQILLGTCAVIHSHDEALQDGGNGFGALNQL